MKPRPRISEGEEWGRRSHRPVILGVTAYIYSILKPPAGTAGGRATAEAVDPRAVNQSVALAKAC
jgi:hypothetical protein